jgi:16S rRNA (guanine527-N7)-methyltransferase
MKQLNLGARRLGIDLSTEQLDRFETYYDELIHWNSKINLTAITDYEEVQIKHFLDSLTIILAGKELDNASVIDIGSGAGLPGLPLKILYPDLKLTLLEATSKKVSFLKYLIDKLALYDVSIINNRAEEAAHSSLYREKFDIALSRAVAKMATLVELVLPFCKTGGFLIAQKKGDIKEEMKQASHAINILGGRLIYNKKVSLDMLPDDRYLVIVEKKKQTPSEFPRLPGMPTKKPL